MDVSKALAARRSVRAFTSEALPDGLLVNLLEKATRAPSGGNLQPWHVAVLESNAMARFREMMEPRIENGTVDTPEYPVYPPNLHEPYRSRRFAVGEAMYARLGIPRDDKPARLAWFANNARFFGAPAAVFVFADRAMGAAQWSDIGMFMQSFMLLAVEAGLATCPQEYWSVHHEAVTTFCETPPELMLFSGIAVGYEDAAHPVNALKTDRAPRDEWLKVL
ncbi:MAG: nitroreductase [Pseudomonadota bacterium]